jgi:hypothetical protein
MKTPRIIAAVALLTLTTPAVAAIGNSCWGEATRVFAKTGAMGEHASEQEQPRVGLANLARALYDAGVIPEPSMGALGAFVASELGLSLERCTSDTLAVAAAEQASAAQAACWGQASAVFAQMGVMGQHASQQPSPRAGLRNLARMLAEFGVIADDSMASLGAFVSATLGLSVDACQ